MTGVAAPFVVRACRLQSQPKYCDDHEDEAYRRAVYYLSDVEDIGDEVEQQEMVKRKRPKKVRSVAEAIRNKLGERGESPSEDGDASDSNNRQGRKTSDGYYGTGGTNSSTNTNANTNANGEAPRRRRGRPPKQATAARNKDTSSALSSLSSLSSSFLSSCSSSSVSLSTVTSSKKSQQDEDEEKDENDEANDLEVGDGRGVVIEGMRRKREPPKRFPEDEGVKTCETSRGKRKTREEDETNTAKSESKGSLRLPEPQPQTSQPPMKRPRGRPRKHPLPSTPSPPSLPAHKNCSKEESKKRNGLKERKQKLKKGGVEEEGSQQPQKEEEKEKDETETTPLPPNRKRGRPRKYPRPKDQQQEATKTVHDVDQPHSSPDPSCRRESPPAQPAPTDIVSQKVGFRGKGSGTDTASKSLSKTPQRSARNVSHPSTAGKTKLEDQEEDAKDDETSCEEHGEEETDDEDDTSVETSPVLPSGQRRSRQPTKRYPDVEIYPITKTIEANATRLSVRSTLVSRKNDLQSNVRASTKGDCEVSNPEVARGKGRQQQSKSKIENDPTGSEDNEGFARESQDDGFCRSISRGSHDNPTNKKPCDHPDSREGDTVGNSGDEMKGGSELPMEQDRSSRTVSKAMLSTREGTTAGQKPFPPRTCYRDDDDDEEEVSETETDDMDDDYDAGIESDDGEDHTDRLHTSNVTSQLTRKHRLLIRQQVQQLEFFESVKRRQEHRSPKTFKSSTARDEKPPNATRTPAGGDGVRHEGFKTTEKDATENDGSVGDRDTAASCGPVPDQEDDHQSKSCGENYADNARYGDEGENANDSKVFEGTDVSAQNSNRHGSGEAYSRASQDSRGKADGTRDEKASSGGGDKVSDDHANNDKGKDQTNLHAQSVRMSSRDKNVQAAKESLPRPSQPIKRVQYRPLPPRRSIRGNDSYLQQLAEQIVLPLPASPSGDQNRRNNVVFITGAGLSVGSGIRPFRGPDGLWGQVIWTKATREAFRKNPLEWYRTFWMRHFPPRTYPEPPKSQLTREGQNVPESVGSSSRTGVNDVETAHGREAENQVKLNHEMTRSRFFRPNDGHEALSAIASLHAEDSAVRIITQNIDGLHSSTTTAWNHSENLIEAHGRLGLYKCIPLDSSSEEDSSDDEDDFYDEDESSLSGVRQQRPRRPVKLGSLRSYRTKLQQMKWQRRHFAKRWAASRKVHVICPYELERSIHPSQMEPSDARRVLWDNHQYPSLPSSPKLKTKEAEEPHTLSKPTTNCKPGDKSTQVGSGGDNGKHRPMVTTSLGDQGISAESDQDRENLQKGSETTVPDKEKIVNAFPDKEEITNGPQANEKHTSLSVPEVDNEKSDPEKDYGEKPHTRRKRKRGPTMTSTPPPSPVMKAPPLCPSCRRPCPPQALLFDEGYHSHSFYQFEKMEKWVAEADVLVFVGTSFAVSLTDVALEHARQTGIPVYNFNMPAPHGALLERSPRLNVVNIVGDVNETLPRLLSLCETLAGCEDVV